MNTLAAIGTVVLFFIGTAVAVGSWASIVIRVVRWMTG